MAENERERDTQRNRNVDDAIEEREKEREALDKGKKKEKEGTIPLVLGIIIALIGIPLVISSIFYFLVPSFRDFSNSALSKVPGPVGSYFGSLPTVEERNNNIRQIAEYMLSIDSQQAVDKLILLEKNDKGTFNSVKDVMIRINPNVTTQLLDKVREKGVKQDEVNKLMGEIQGEIDLKNQKEADLIKTLSKAAAKDELYRIINGSINGYKDVAGVMEKMDPAFAATMMQLLTPDETNRILSLMLIDKANALKMAMAEFASRQNVINNAADIYSAQSAELLLPEIGDAKKFKITELPIIYKKIGVIKAGQVMALIEDKKFLYSLLDAIKDHEIVTTGNDFLTKDMITSLNIHKKFDDKVSRLATVYEKVEPVKVAKYIDELIKNASKPKKYNLTNGESIIISDEKIAAGILNKFSDKKKGEVIKNLDDFTATEVSKMLATP